MQKIPSTELLHPESSEIDALPTAQVLVLLLNDQAQAAQAVQAALPALEQAVDAAVQKLQAGGRLIYMGAGTSGRLGLLDATELQPTFSWPSTQALGLIAGGPKAIAHAAEGAEDDAAQAEPDLRAINFNANDVLIGIAASGSTPYVVAALQYARAVGGLTIGMANSAGGQILVVAEIPVLLDTGPEIISGSTRLKAGTAQKIALNSFSSACMVRLGKVYKNLMVDVRASNAKLLRRALRLVCIATDCDETVAQMALEQCDWQVKTAIVMIVRGLDVNQARTELQAANGFVRFALNKNL